MKRLLYIAFLLSLAASCDKVVTYETDLHDRFANDGAPQIDSIFDINDGSLEHKLTEGALAQLIHIKGRNLANPVSVEFNGVPANLEDCYCENADSYILIPRLMPGEVTNKLVYRTSRGVAEYDFAISIPELSLTGLANEFAPGGSSVQVVGDYFDLFGFGAEGSDASITLNGAPVQIDSVSATWMSVVIPEGTPDNSLLTFSWNDMERGPQTKRIPYRNTEYLFFGDFGTAGFWSEALKEEHLTDGSAEGNPASLGYRFLHFNKDIPGGAWYSIGLGDGWYYNTPEDWATDWELKFEIWTNPAKPVPAYSYSGLMIQLNLMENVGLDLGGVAFNTGGEWRTLRFPLGKIVSKMPKYGDYWGFAFTVSPPSDWTVDFAVANFRIEPINY